MSDALDEQEFYELMQAYRHCPMTDFAGVNTAFEAVKTYVRRDGIDGESRRFLKRYFGATDNETLGQAIERTAMQENPSQAFFRAAGKGNQ